MDDTLLLLLHPEMKRAYLDVETDFSGKISVIGVSSGEGDFVQFYGEDVTFQNLERVLLGKEVIVTFNGDRFDLPLIKRELNFDVKLSYISLDLFRVKKRMGIGGGLKEVERYFGIRRSTQISGRDAPFLWDHYIRYGDLFALQLLLTYNREDVLNLIELENKLRSMLQNKYEGNL